MIDFLYSQEIFIAIILGIFSATVFYSTYSKNMPLRFGRKWQPSDASPMSIKVVRIEISIVCLLLVIISIGGALEHKSLWKILSLPLQTLFAALLYIALMSLWLWITTRPPKN